MIKLVRQENSAAEEADSLTWFAIGGAGSLILATGNPALEYFGLSVHDYVRACLRARARTCVCVILGVLSNIIHELVSNPKHHVLFFTPTGHVPRLTASY